MDARLINIIKNYFSNQPIDKAYLFGSYSRGEETPKSDIDLLVTFSKNSNISLFKYAHLVNELQRLTEKKIDLVEEGQLISEASQTALKDKVLIYERKA